MHDHILLDHSLKSKISKHMYVGAVNSLMLQAHAQKLGYLKIMRGSYISKTLIIYLYYTCRGVCNGKEWAHMYVKI